MQGHGGGSKALSSAARWPRAQALGSCILGRVCVSLGEIQKDFFPREFFPEVSHKLPLEERPLWHRDLAPFVLQPACTPWIQIYGGHGLSPSVLPQIRSPELIFILLYIHLSFILKLILIRCSVVLSFPKLVFSAHPIFYHSYLVLFL